MSRCHDVRCLTEAAAASPHALCCIQINKQVSAYRHHVCTRLSVPCCMRVCVCVCVCVCQRGIFWVNRLWWRRLQHFIKLPWCRGWQSDRDYRQTGSVCVQCVCVCVSFLSAPYPPHRWWCSLILPPCLLRLACAFCFLLAPFWL